MKIKVSVIDNYDIFRKGINAICDDFNIEIVGMFCNIEEYVESLETKQCFTGNENMKKCRNKKHIIIVRDILLYESLPNTNFKQKNDDSVFIVSITGDNISYITEVLENAYYRKNIVGAIMEDTSIEKILSIIKDVSIGKINFPKKVEEIYYRILTEVSKDTYSEKKRKTNLLTVREKEVLTYISKGMSNKEIAVKMDISEHTIKNHISHIFHKINVTDRTQAAIYSLNNYISIKK